MTFRQLFEKYKNGTASPEEIALVEEELEKNEVINAYLASQLLEQPSLSLPPENTPQLHQVKSSVRRKFWMMTALCCAIVLLLGFLVQAVALPLYNNQFYNPAQTFKNGPDYTLPLDVDLQIFTRLTCPGWTANSAHVQPLGLGKYNVTFSQSNPYSGQETHHLQVTRGEIPYPVTAIPFHTAPAGVFYDRGPATTIYVDEFDGETTAQPEETRQFYLEEVAQMPKGAYLSAFVSFQEDLSLEQLTALKEQYPHLLFDWAAVRISDDWYFNEIGFPVEYGGIILEDIPDLAEYGPLDLNNAAWKEATPKEQAELLEGFFTSMLSYLSTRDEFLQAFCNFNGISAEYYHEALGYVEENGVAVYGLLLSGRPEDMLAFCENPQVNSFCVNGAKFSVLQ